MNVLLRQGSRLLRGPSDPSRLRRLNALSVIDVIRHEALTIPAIARATGLSKTASDSVVTHLLDLGWVTAEDPLAPTGAGRPASRYRFRAEAAVVVGVDIGQHTTRVVIADLNGAPLTDGVAAADAASDPGTLIAFAVERTGELLGALGRRREDVWSIGVAFPAVVEDGIVVRGSHGWDGFDIRAAFSAHFDCLTSVDNDSNLAALAEAWKGSATESHGLVYVHSGERTGSGLILNGEVFRGTRGAAGEIGALPQLGWESAQQHLRGVQVDDGRLLERAQVFEGARDGHPAAVAAVDAFAEAIATGIAALVLTVDPDVVVVGGGNTRAGDVFLEPLRRHVDALCIVREAPPLVLSSLQERASVTGAVGLAVTSVLQRLYDVLLGGETLPRADGSGMAFRAGAPG
ncbi:ROK family protein [Microbacterium sp. NPDC058342]|uniref:ROK family transcriptional regulator n=1 Tax=Microbacterium sp. NPDC058342 TaxID=3346454 RepID=UPI003648111D